MAARRAIEVPRHIWWIANDKIEFSFKVSGQVEGTVSYSGTTDGKTMKGKLSLAGLGEGTFSGKKK